MKTIFTLLFLAICCLANAQQGIPNASFENWHSVPSTFGGEDPDGWRSNNAVTAGANKKGIAKSTDAYTGDYALELTPLISFDSTSFLASQICIGSPELNFATYGLNIETGGYFFGKNKPLRLYGFYKYVPDTSANDSVFAVVYLGKYIDTLDSLVHIGVGEHTFSPVSSYTLFNVVIAQYLNIDTADTVIIAFSYRSNNTNTFPSGKLLIDDLSYTEPTSSLNELEMENSIQVFPNPTNKKIHLKKPADILINKLVLMDVSGKKVRHFNADHTQLDVTGLPAGNYLLKINTKTGQKVEKIVIVE